MYDPLHFNVNACGVSCKSKPTTLVFANLDSSFFLRRKETKMLFLQTCFESISQLVRVLGDDIIFLSFSGSAPKFIEKPSIKQQGSLIVMSCVVEATPEPRVRWFRGDSEVKAGGRWSIRTEAVSGQANAYRLICEITVRRVAEVHNRFCW